MGPIATAAVFFHVSRGYFSFDLSDASFLSPTSDGTLQ